MSYESKFALAESSGQEGCFARIDETHPVGIFLGVETGQRAVLVVCSKRPPDVPPLAAIHVESRLRQGSEWALVLRLTRPDLKGLFTKLVEDLDRATREQAGDPGAVVIARLVRWQSLLSRGLLGILDDDALRGLAAELDFLITEAVPAFGIQTAAMKWVGQFDAPKDFVFDTAEVEVKAIHRQQRSITISSLEQLTDAGLPLFLWSRVVALTTTVQGDPNSFSAYVGRVRAAASHDSVAAERIEKCLKEGGYEDRPEYGLRGVQFGPGACYQVTSSFPRLQRTQVSSGILTCKYEIAVADLEPFRVTSWREAPRNAR